MKIAILGAPGSGKTKLAGVLQKALMPDIRTVVLDDYVTKLQNDSGQAYGMMGNHIDDLTVVFKRLEWERTWTNRDRNTITVGTVLDSAAHNFARTEIIEHMNAAAKEIGIERQAVALTQVKLQAIAATFGLLYTDTWDYDYAFLLTRPKTRVDGHYQKTVEFTLATLIGIYHAPVLTFEPEVLDDEKANLAAETIRSLEKDGAPSPDERGVRRSGTDGEADGDPSEPVSDVPEQGTD